MSIVNSLDDVCMLAERGAPGKLFCVIDHETVPQARCFTCTLCLAHTLGNIETFFDDSGAAIKIVNAEEIGV